MTKRRSAPLACRHGPQQDGSGARQGSSSAVPPRGDGRRRSAYHLARVPARLLATHRRGSKDISGIHNSTGDVAAVASATATALAKGVLNAMMISKLKILGTATLACVLALGGIKTNAFQFGSAGGDGSAVARNAGQRRNPRSGLGTVDREDPR